MTEAQTLLKLHLSELGIESIPEYRFSERRFRFDLYIPRFRMGIEVNGHYQGKHGKGWDGGHDNEKIRLAQVLGFKILPFTNGEVLSGRAKEWLAEWIGPILPKESK